MLIYIFVPCYNSGRDINRFQSNESIWPNPRNRFFCKIRQEKLKKKIKKFLFQKIIQNITIANDASRVTLQIVTSL